MSAALAAASTSEAVAPRRGPSVAGEMMDAVCIARKGHGPAVFRVEGVLSWASTRTDNITASVLVAVRDNWPRESRRLMHNPHRWARHCSNSSGSRWWEQALIIPNIALVEHIGGPEVADLVKMGDCGGPAHPLR